jgi:hypothetical protein
MMPARAPWWTRNLIYVLLGAAFSFWAGVWIIIRCGS